jgi:ligand-binding sensor domain-containing protein
MIKSQQGSTIFQVLMVTALLSASTAIVLKQQSHSANKTSSDYLRKDLESFIRKSESVMANKLDCMSILKFSTENSSNLTMDKFQVGNTYLVPNLKLNSSDVFLQSGLTYGYTQKLSLNATGNQVDTFSVIRPSINDLTINYAVYINDPNLGTRKFDRSFKLKTSGDTSSVTSCFLDTRSTISAGLKKFCNGPGAIYDDVLQKCYLVGLNTNLNCLNNTYMQGLSFDPQSMTMIPVCLGLSDVVLDTSGCSNNQVPVGFGSDGKVVCTNLSASYLTQIDAAQKNKVDTECLDNHLKLSTDTNGFRIKCETGTSLTTTNTNTVIIPQGSASPTGTPPALYVGTNNGISITSNNGQSFNTYTTVHGLGGNTVKDLILCTSGACATSLIAATSGGLSVTQGNGMTFSNYNFTHGLESNTVQGVGVSNSTYYTVGGNNGVSSGALGNFHFKNLGASTKAIYYESPTVIIGSGTNGLSISADDGATYSHKGVVDGLASNTVNKIKKFGNTYYIATNNGLSITSNLTNFSTINTTNGLASNIVNSVYAFTSNVFYVATKNGLSMTTNGGLNFTTATTANGLGDNTVNDVLVYNGIIYAATNNGISISANGGVSFSNYTTAEGLGGNTAYTLAAVNPVTALQMPTGTASPTPSPSPYMIYVAGNGGASYSSNRGSSFTKSMIGTLFDVTTDNQTVYFAANSAGLLYYSNGDTSFTQKTQSDGLGSNPVFSVRAMGGNIYAATNGGTSISTNNGSSFTNATTVQGLGTNINIKVAYSGSNVFVSNFYLGGGGVSVSNNNGASYTTRTVANGLASNNAEGCLKTFGAKLYVCTDAGLSISQDQGTTFTTILNNYKINDFFIEGSTYYVATTTGLLISNDSGLTYRIVTTANGLPSNKIVSVISKGMDVYVGSNNWLGVSNDGGNSFILKSSGIINNGINALAIGPVISAMPTPTGSPTNTATPCTAKDGTACGAHRLFLSNTLLSHAACTGSCTKTAMDAICQQDATSAGLVMTYKAVIGSDTKGVRAFFETGVENPDAPYHYLNYQNGNIVTIGPTTLTDLWANGPTNWSKMSTAGGSAPSTTYYWTGSPDSVGSAPTDTSTENCQNWTNFGAAKQGYVGMMNGNWLNEAQMPCNSGPYALLCVSTKRVGD